MIPAGKFRCCKYIKYKTNKKCVNIILLKEGLPQILAEIVTKNTSWSVQDRVIKQRQTNDTKSVWTERLRSKMKIKAIKIVILDLTGRMQHSENIRVHISTASSSPEHIRNIQFMSVSRTLSNQEINSLVTWKIKTCCCDFHKVVEVQRVYTPPLQEELGFMFTEKCIY